MSGLAGSLRAIVSWFHGADVPFMVTGSFASTFHGHPRATQDIDIVVDPAHDALLRFLASLPPERVYVDNASALEAFKRRDMFNVIDLETGWKVDVIFRKNRAFSRAEFERRQAVEWLGVPLFVAAAEDVILSKLEWAKLCGGSERQMRDVSGVLEMRRAQLDHAYIESWLDVLGIRPLWEQVTATGL